jgi:hypothetical protein
MKAFNRKGILAFSAVLGVAVAAGSVQAAEPGFCRDYARAAANQARDAHAHPRCREAIERDPARWQLDFRGHYDWCIAHSRRDADAERGARTETLEHCAR